MAARVLLLHVGALGWNVIGVWQNVAVTEAAEGHGAHTYGGRWKYLTFINQVLQTVFFAVCLLADLAQLFHSSKKGLSHFLLLLRDFTFCVLAFPIGVFVVTSFWSIYAYDRELIYPAVLDSLIPQWLNHSMDFMDLLHGRNLGVSDFSQAGHCGYGYLLRRLCTGHGTFLSPRREPHQVILG
ncbi:hypothetical protein FKM82_022166 [Ascaphus truei]